MKYLLFTSNIGKWVETNADDFESWLELLETAPQTIEERGVRVAMTDAPAPQWKSVDQATFDEHESDKTTF